MYDFDWTYDFNKHVPVLYEITINSDILSLYLIDKYSEELRLKIFT